MEISQNGLHLIETFEGCSFTAYQDQRGIWTCGVGHTGPDVVEGTVCTEAQADAWLKADVATAEAAVNRLILPAMLNQNRFDALVSFTYNEGQGSLEVSTVRRRLNLEDFVGAAAAFLMWDEVKVNGQEEVDPGLLRRRTAEQAMFSTPEE